MTVFAFLAIAYTQRLGGHVRMELILGRMKWAGPLFLRSYWHVVRNRDHRDPGYYGYTHFLRAFEFGDTTIDVNMPIWPSKLMVPLAFSVLIVRLFIQLAGSCGSSCIRMNK